MRSPVVPVAMVALAAVGAAASGPVPVGIPRAQSAALARAPGELANTTLAIHRGRLVYGVDIDTAPGTVTSVEVDAVSDRVIRVTNHRVPAPFPAEVEAP